MLTNKGGSVRRLVNVMLIFHWMGVFGLLAGLALSDARHGVSAVLSMLGAARADTADLAPGGLVTALLAAALTLAALMCAWAFLAEWTDGRAEGMDPFRIALAGCGFALTMAAGYAMFYDIGMVAGTVALYFLALLATHLVVTREEVLERLRSGEGDATARAMAAGAARYYAPGFPRAGQPAAGGAG